MDKLYFLRNNTFLKQEADLTNTEYKVLNLIMARMQKVLLDKYPIWDKSTIEKMDVAMHCYISLDEIKQLDIRRQSVNGEKLKEMLDKLNTKHLKFVSYITGGYVSSHLIAEYEVIKKGNSVDIKIVMSKQVFMFLLDYKGTFNFRDNFPDVEEVKNSPKPTKKLLAKGYSKLEIGVMKKIKSYYSQVMYTHFKAELEKRAIKDRDIKKFNVTYELEWLRNILGLNEANRHKKYGDFRRSVLEVVKKELDKNNFFKISYTENLAVVRGRRRVVSIGFDVVAGKDLEYNIPKIKIDSPSDEPCVDVEFEEVRETLAKSLCFKLIENSSIQLAVSTIQNFIDTYGETNVKRAINSLIIKSEEERVRAPKKYLLKVLEDMHDRENITSIDNDGRGDYTSNNSKRLKQLKANGLDVMGFNNFEPREYDYKKLESELTSWYQSDEDDIQEMDVNKDYNEILRDIKSREEKDCP